jgi:hypothetical protein
VAVPEDLCLANAGFMGKATKVGGFAAVRMVEFLFCTKRTIDLANTLLKSRSETFSGQAIQDLSINLFFD